MAAVLLTALPVIALAVMSLVSRRPENLDVTGGRLAPCPESPNCVSSQADDDAHRIEPLTFSGSADEAMSDLIAVVESMPRTEIVTRREDYLHVEFTSPVFRFTDDVEFLLNDEVKVIHVRSASRTGRSDLGANRKRVEEIRRLFSTQRREGAKDRKDQGRVSRHLGCSGCPQRFRSMLRTACKWALYHGDTEARRGRDGEIERRRMNPDQCSTSLCLPLSIPLPFLFCVSVSPW
ncbi:MAG: DUF1499 domain-containing protein [Planctomycetaceae bacterium]